MSAGEYDVGSPAWYQLQFGTQKSYREMLFGDPALCYYDDPQLDLAFWETMKRRGGVGGVNEP